MNESPNKSAVVEESFDVKERRVIDMLRNSIVPEIVIHGEKFKLKDGNEGLGFEPDLDIRGALYLLDLAGVDYKKLTVVPKGDSIPGSFMIDTGATNYDGMDSKGSVYADHHGKERDNIGETTSSTEIVYDILVKSGLLARDGGLEEIVRFVNQIDNLDYSMSRDDLIESWWRSFYCLHYFISFESLVDLIKDGRKANHVFSEEEARNITVTTKKGEKVLLLDLCLKQKQTLVNSMKYVERISQSRSGRPEDRNLDSRGIRKNGKDLGAVLTNIVEGRNQIPLGFTLARGLGFDSYVSFYEKTGGFFITSRFDLGVIYSRLLEKFPDVKLVRGTMILYQPKDTEKSGTSVMPDEFFKILKLID